MPEQDVERATRPDPFDLNREVNALLEDLIEFDLPSACLENLHRAVSDAYKLSLGLGMGRIMGDDARRMIEADSNGDEVTVNHLFTTHFSDARALVLTGWEKFAREFKLDTRILECLFSE